MIYIIDVCVCLCVSVGWWVWVCGWVYVCARARVCDGYSWQSNTLYSNINFILVSKYFQIIKTMKITFFQHGHSTVG